LFVWHGTLVLVFRASFLNMKLFWRGNFRQDADLIMLGLSSHDPHFSIFRERVLLPDSKNCFLCGQVIRA